VSRSTVSLVRSNSHYEGVKKALDFIAPHVAKSLEGKRKVIVKPNFTSTTRQLAATHVDAVRAVLDLVTEHYSGRITLAEGPSFSNLSRGLRNFNYLGLRSEYGVEFIDLNEDDYIEVEVLDRNLREMKLRVAKTTVDSDYRISVVPPKTHDCVVVTLSMKNMVVGSLVDHDKSKIHQGYKALNLNIAKLVKVMLPHLGVIDGSEGMEGSGPISGEPMHLGVAIAGLDAVAVDAVTAKIMGFNPLDIGYLHYLNEWKVGVADPNNIEVLGVPINDVARRFKPHPAYHEQLKWKLNRHELASLTI